MYKNFALALSWCLFLVAPAQAQVSGLPGGITNGGARFPGGSSFSGSRTSKSNPGSAYAGRLPPTSLGSIAFDITEGVGCGGGGNSFPGSGGSGGSGGGSGGGGGSYPDAPVPPDCRGCYPVVNTHNGSIMGWKNPDETWYEFWTGQSGHLSEEWLPEGQICLQQMINAGMDPYSPGIPFGLGM